MMYEAGSKYAVLKVELNLGQKDIVTSDLFFDLLVKIGQTALLRPLCLEILCCSDMDFRDFVSY